MILSRKIQLVTLVIIATLLGSLRAAPVQPQPSNILTSIQDIQRKFSSTNINNSNNKNRNVRTNDQLPPVENIPATVETSTGAPIEKTNKDAEIRPSKNIPFPTKERESLLSDMNARQNKMFGYYGYYPQYAPQIAPAAAPAFYPQDYYDDYSAAAYGAYPGYSGYGGYGDNYVGLGYGGLSGLGGIAGLGNYGGLAAMSNYGANGLDVLNGLGNGGYGNGNLNSLSGNDAQLANLNALGSNGQLANLNALGSNNQLANLNALGNNGALGNMNSLGGNGQLANLNALSNSGSLSNYNHLGNAGEQDQMNNYNLNNMGNAEEEEILSRTNQGHRRRPQQNFKNSPIYYIRLPPTPYMFVPGLGYISQPPTITPMAPISPIQSLGGPQPVSPFYNIPLNFLANGKPSNIYQWGGNGYGQSFVQPQYSQFGIPHYPPPRPQRPYQRPFIQDSKITHLKGPFLFNGRPEDIFLLQNSFNPIYPNPLNGYY